MVVVDIVHSMSPLPLCLLCHSGTPEFSLMSKVLLLAVLLAVAEAVPIVTKSTPEKTSVTHTDAED